MTVWISLTIAAIGVIVTTVAAPLAAQTTCPTAADLTRGIKVGFADGSTEIYRSVGNGVVSVKGLNAVGEKYEIDLAQGLYLLMYQAVENGVPVDGSRIEYDYGVPPTDLPLPTPGKRWQSDVSVTASDGIRNEPQVHVYDAMVTDMIGGCEYDMISVLISYETSDLYSETIHYLPALGLGYLLWNETIDQPRDPVPAVAITVMGK